MRIAAHGNTPKVLINRPISNRQGCCTSSENSGHPALHENAHLAPRKAASIAGRTCLYSMFRNCHAIWIEGDVSGNSCDGRVRCLVGPYCVRTAVTERL